MKYAKESSLVNERHGCPRFATIVATSFLFILRLFLSNLFQLSLLSVVFPHDTNWGYQYIDRYKHIKVCYKKPTFSSTFLFEKRNCSILYLIVSMIFDE